METSKLYNTLSFYGLSLWIEDTQDALETKFGFKGSAVFILTKKMFKYFLSFFL